MENFILALTANPLLYIGYAVALFAAAGVLYFISGFIGGMKFQISFDEDADHLSHARTHAMQGLYICMVALGIWEAIRIVLGELPPVNIVLVLILLSPAWIPPLKALLSGGGKSGH